MRPDGLIAGGCSNAGACERTACEAGVGCALLGLENRDDWFDSNCLGGVEAIDGGTVTDGGGTSVLEPVVWVGG